MSVVTLPTLPPTRESIQALVRGFRREGMADVAMVLNVLDQHMNPGSTAKRGLRELARAAKELLYPPRPRAPKKPVNWVYNEFVARFRSHPHSSFPTEFDYAAHVARAALEDIRKFLDCEGDRVDGRSVTVADVLAKSGESRDPAKIMKAALAACGVEETRLRNVEAAENMRRSRATKKRQALARSPAH
jgi:hypothetical protein